MANKILQAADWNTAGSWNPSGVPTDDDHAFISHGLDLDVDTGLDQGGIKLDLIHIPPDYVHNIGSSGSPLKIAADEVKHYGGGSLYYSSDLGSSDAHQTDYMMFACTNANVHNEVTSNSADIGEIGRIVVHRGRVILGADLDFDDTIGSVLVGYIGNQAADAYVELTSGIDTCPLLVQGGGVVRSWGTVTTLAIAAGSFTMEGSAAATTVYVGSGATLTWNSTGTAATLLMASDATLNLNGNVAQKTITTTHWSPNSTVNFVDDLVTITNKYDERRITD